MDLKKLEFTDGPYPGTSDLKITVDDLTLVLLAKKEITQEEAVKQGNLKIEGDADAVSKLAFLQSKLA